MIFGIPVFLAILAFVLVIFIHELGHYLVGRLCGIGVNAFSIGFGPKLISYTDNNNTEWKLCLIPLGGFVQFQTNNKILQPKFHDNAASKITQCDFESASILFEHSFQFGRFPPEAVIARDAQPAPPLLQTMWH